MHTAEMEGDTTSGFGAIEEGLKLNLSDKRFTKDRHQTKQQDPVVVPNEVSFRGSTNSNQTILNLGSCPQPGTETQKEDT